MSHYFSGEGGFSQKKSRNDFPDAVIYDAIVKISKDTDGLYFLCKDGNLKKLAERIQGVKILNSVKDFLQLPFLKGKIENLNKKNKRISSILEYLTDEDCESKITSYFEKIGIEELENTFFIEDWKDFFSDIHTVNFDIISELKIKAKEKYSYFYLDGNPSYLGGDKFSIPVWFDEIESSVSFYCPEEQYENMPYKLRTSLSFNIDNEGRSIVSGTLDVEYRGVVIIENVAEDFTDNDLKIYLSFLDTEQCKISCHMVIDSWSISCTRYC
ncbi:hypothetical protein GMJAKD_16725 [Candidatus Electrothrix aarhusensis]